MDLKELEQIIFKPSSMFMRKEGEEILKRGLVSNVSGKKIDNTYHIYGRIKRPIGELEFRTHLTIDMVNKKLAAVSCNCDTFNELSIHKNLFLCQHITATAYRFLNLYEEKTRNSNDDTNKKLGKRKEKIQLELDIKIISRAWKDFINYEFEFRVGSEYKYLIKDLKSFINSIEKNETVFFNEQFSYNPKENFIKVEDMAVIKYIKGYIKNEKDDYNVTRSLTVPSKDLRGLLECIGERKVNFKFNDIEYKTSIHIKDLPLSFTLKDKNDEIALITYKKLPQPLNDCKSVYFFNNIIYLPSNKQVENYGKLYEKFKYNNEVLYPRTPEVYKKILSIITTISNNITISDELKNFIYPSLTVEILIYKEDFKIYGDVYVIYKNKKINILKHSTTSQLPERDYNREEKLIMKLEAHKFIRKNDKFMFIGEDEDLFNVLNSSSGGIRSLGKIILGKGIKDIKIYNSHSIEIDIYEEMGCFKMNYSIGDLGLRELNRAFESFRAKEKFYKTKDNSFIDLEDQGIKNLFNLIEMMNINHDIEDTYLNIEKSKALFMVETLKNSGFNKSIDDLLEGIEHKLKHINNEEIMLPKGLRVTLREYQVKAFKWFKNLSALGLGGILADEMGLGKTVETIAFIASEKESKSLIVTPTSLIYNWQEEIAKFAPELKVGILHGDKSKQKLIINNLKEYDILLTTYGTLKNNVEEYNHIEFDYCIIDEAQNIKNSMAQITRVVKEIKAKVKFALTGTPMENNLTELWSIFDFVMPGYLYSKDVFYNKFVYNGDRDLESLKLLIKPFILRRTKKEVIEDLPDKIEKKIFVEMTAAQKALYTAYMKIVRNQIKNNLKGKIEIFSYLTKLRQMCLDPSLIDEEYSGGSGKLKVALELVENQIEINGKVLLFSQFTSALKKIGKALEQKNIEYFYLDGATDSKERIRLVNEFNSGNKVKVFLISLKAGGTGLNLTSANLVVHFDPWWNPAVENQATDRAHRIGQRNVVEVIKLIARETIEEKIVSLQENKKELIDSVITGELKYSNALNRLTTEELIELFYR